MTVDERLHAWGEQQRAARTEPVHVNVDPPPSAHHRPGRYAALTAAAVVIVLAAVVVGVTSHNRAADQRQRSTPASPVSDPRALIGIEWVSDRWRFGSESGDRYGARLRFDETRADGNAGMCSTLHARVIYLPNNSLSLVDLGANLSTCAFIIKPTAEQQRRYKLEGEAFSSVLGTRAPVRWKISGNRLMLSSGSATLTYHRATQADRLEVIRRLKSGVTPTGESFALGASISFILLAHDGKISGSDGCRRFEGQYRIDGSDIVITSRTPSPTTVCGKPAISDAVATLTAPGRLQWQLNGDDLVLRRDTIELTFH